MRPLFPQTNRLVVLCSILFLVISCSKDTDLLSDYVVSDYSEARLIGNFVVNDNYFIANNKKKIVLDILSNDIFENPGNVKIVELTPPSNGTVTLNKDNTITYTSGTEEEVEEQNTSEENEEEQAAPDEVKEEEQKPDTTEENAEEQPTTSEQPNTAEEVENTEENVESETKNEQETDSFGYTVETENEDGTTTTQNGTVTVTRGYGELKAFPTAEGYGKYTTGGRGGRVIHVTNLKDKGAGSLRDALRESGTRTIVFDISGYIDIRSQITIRNPNVTIAGQTAPGDGITVRGGAISIRTGNVIMRHLRIRPGSNAYDGADCVNVIANKDNQNIRNVIIDHCSVSWSKDENMAFGASPRYTNNSIKDATIQNCINSEPLKYYAILMARNLGRISLVKNLFAHAPSRIPESSYGYTPEDYEFNNNIVYNYNRATVMAYGVDVDVIGNVYKTKTTPAIPNLTYVRNGINNPDGKPTDGKVYENDNMQIGSNPKGMTNSKWDQYNQSSKVHTDSRYQPMNAFNLEKNILNDVGANVFDDPVDKRIIREYMDVKGVRGPKSESNVGGYPSLTEVKRPSNYDKDKDGMADAWELENGFDPNNGKDGQADEDGDGYTNLEDFLYSLTLN